MAEKKRKSKTGAPLTEVFAMRLDPKLKYLAGIAARKQRRSLANFFEWAVELGLKKTDLDEDSEYSSSVWEKSNKLWDVDEPDRLANLAFEEPALMTYDEQIIWKLICETSYMWRGRYDSNGEWTWRILPEKLNNQRLRECWNDFKKVSSGEAEREILPKVVNEKFDIKSSGFGDTDEDIPF